MDRTTWIRQHPYLAEISDIQQMVDAAVNEFTGACTSIPAWDNYTNDYRAGVPMLSSQTIVVDCEHAGKSLGAVVVALSTNPLPTMFSQAILSIRPELECDPAGADSAIRWLVGEASFTSAGAGVLRYLGWMVLARYLQPVVASFAAWRDEEQWMRNYCPTCGDKPAMGQLVGVDPGKLRVLVCGACGTRWRYRRTGCPFCEASEGEKLKAMTVSGESGLRVEYCDICRGYLKTYDGIGSEDVMLADWTSVHLDVLASDHGLKRLATSLYQL